MEIILAIVVASAVIFFGALISMGNERQRRGIDDLREQVILWAIQDLKIKRDNLAQTAKVIDPIEWFSKLAARVLGRESKLQFLEAFDGPKALMFVCKITGIKLVFCLSSKKDISILRKSKRSRLSNFTSQHPLLNLSHNTNPTELSVLNCGLLFDLELSLVWKEFSGECIDETNSLWIYKITEGS